MAYVYMNYGIYYLINAVTEAAGCPAAVLIHALQPLAGAALMMKRRAPGGRRVADADLCRGPANVTCALGIILAENGVDLTRGPVSGRASSRLSIEDRGLTPGRISRGPRVGIRVGVERP
jgi:DNA-3-methyladenine glycosylase